MITFRSISQLKKKYPRPVLAIGIFDGLHKGHCQVIEKTVSLARTGNGTAMLMTFDPHPVHVLKPEICLPLIMPLEYRLRLIAQLGIDVCVVLPFTRSFAHLKPEEFIRKYLLDKIGPSTVVVGDDFRFGQDRQGTLQEFQALGEEFGFSVLGVRALCGEKKSVSSSAIRALIAQGQLQKAARLLGRPFALCGEVVHGDARGRQLDYPTANLNVGGLVVPPNGVYVVTVQIASRTYGGVANIGTRPSFKTAALLNVEVHVFDYKHDLYGQRICVTFRKKIRDEKFFSSPEALREQIQDDERLARLWLQKAKVGREI